MSKPLIVLPILLACICASIHAVDVTETGTTTKLSISSRSVEIGAPVTLTAKVLLGGAGPARVNRVLRRKSCPCLGLAVLGSAQLTSSGTAEP